MELVLSQHISRLLFEHECVIVPDFGAFLTRYHHAEVNPATHMFRPPSRRIYFNPGLKENDGLLAKSISLTDRMSYRAAQSMIADEVKCWRELLQAGEKVQLKGIGRLFIDDQGKLQFAPGLETNYQRSSYGLAIFRSPAIERDARIRTAIQKSIEKHAPATTHEVTEEKEKPVYRIPWAAVLGPVIFAGIVGAAYLGLKNEPFKDISGLQWIEWSHSRSLDTSGEVITEAPEKSEEKPADVTPKTSDITPEKAEPVKPDLTDVDEIPMTQLYPYHIVVGSFKESGNARSYVHQLKARGYDAYLADGDPRFMRVAVGNFATKAQAENALQGVRQNINSQAWIYSN